MRISDMLEKTTLEVAQDMVNKGVKVCWHQHIRNELLFIPQGWMTCEYVSHDSILTYGVRKSFCTPSQAANKIDDGVVKLDRGSGTDVKRMAPIWQLMSYAG